MKIGRKLKLKHSEKGEMHCEYLEIWNNIPLYVTSQCNNMHYKIFDDKTAIIIIGKVLLDMFNFNLLQSALWHEVSHIYYKDYLKTWTIECEYRADTLAACATSITDVLHSLERVRVLYRSKESLDILDRRQRNLFLNRNAVEIEPLSMTHAIKHAEVIYI